MGWRMYWLVEYESTCRDHRGGGDRDLDRREPPCRRCQRAREREQERSRFHERDRLVRRCSPLCAPSVCVAAAEGTRLTVLPPLASCVAGALRPADPPFPLPV